MDYLFREWKKWLGREKFWTVMHLMQLFIYHTVFSSICSYFLRVGIFYSSRRNIVRLMIFALLFAVALQFWLSLRALHHAKSRKTYWKSIGTALGIEIALAVSTSFFLGGYYDYVCLVFSSFHRLFSAVPLWLSALLTGAILFGVVIGLPYFMRFYYRWKKEQ